VKEVFVRLCLFGLGIGAGWKALGAFRSGKAVDYSRGVSLHFSRVTNPGGFWLIICAYLAFAALTVIVMPLLLLFL
jgi:hypothetical protein